MFQVEDTYELLPKFETETSRQVIDRRDYGHTNVGIMVWFGSEHLIALQKHYVKEWNNPEDKQIQAARILREVAAQIKEVAANEGRI
ncbi:hypothetical protein D3C81_2166340 [compost metagenome]